MLEVLQPHPNLKRLTLYDYGGTKFPSRLPSQTNLTDFLLTNCMKCQHLTLLNQVISLRKLTLYNLKTLQYISENSADDLFCSSLSSIVFPCLERINLCKVPMLKGWWRDDVTCEDEQHTFPFFPLLNLFEMENCPQLTSMTLSPHLEYLSLKCTRWKSFQHYVISTNEAPSSISCSVPTYYYPLSQLRNLGITQEDEQQCLSDLLRNLTFLEVLGIASPTKLMSLSLSIQGLISLWRLIIQRFLGEYLGMPDDHPTTLQTL